MAAAAAGEPGLGAEPFLLPFFLVMVAVFFEGVYTRGDPWGMGGSTIGRRGVKALVGGSERAECSKGHGDGGAGKGTQEFVLAKGAFRCTEPECSCVYCARSAPSALGRELHMWNSDHHRRMNEWLLLLLGALPESIHQHHHHTNVLVSLPL